MSGFFICEVLTVNDRNLPYIDDFRTLYRGAKAAGSFKVTLPASQLVTVLEELAHLRRNAAIGIAVAMKQEMDDLREQVRALTYELDGE